jgi:hypothetical protein
VPGQQNQETKQDDQFGDITEMIFPHNLNVARKIFLREFKQNNQTNKQLIRKIIIWLKNVSLLLQFKTLLAKT